jgi:hypothetical protein
MSALRPSRLDTYLIPLILTAVGVAAFVVAAMEWVP